MDWVEVAKQMEAGAKLYRVFEEGERIASQLSNAGREAQEAQGQYASVLAQVDQAKADLKAAQTEGLLTRTATSQDIARQQAIWEAAHAKQVEAAQAELEAWKEKVADQVQVSQTQAQWYQTQIAQWEGALAKIQAQVASLEQIKASLKSQLQGVV